MGECNQFPAARVIGLSPGVMRCRAGSYQTAAAELFNPHTGTWTARQRRKGRCRSGSRNKCIRQCSVACVAAHGRQTRGGGVSAVRESLGIERRLDSINSPANRLLSGQSDVRDVNLTTPQTLDQNL